VLSNNKPISPRFYTGVIACLWAAGALSVPARAASQERSGPILPTGMVRLDFGLSVHAWDRRFGERVEGGTTIEEEEPLGRDFSSPTVGAGVFPGMAALEAALGLADPSGSFPLSMGATDVFLSQERFSIPLRIDIGVLPWLSVGAKVPFSRRRTEIFVGVDGTGANSGVSPTLTNPTQVSDFLGSIRVATEALAAAAQGICATQGSSSGACSEAQGLFNDAEAFRTSLSGAYTISPAFPLMGTDAANALIDKLGALGQGATQIGVPGFPTSLPLATTALDAESLQTIITDESGTIQGVALEDWRSPWEMGDVEVFANARVLGRSVDRAPSEGRQLRYELGIGLLARLGTGVVDSADNFIDLGTGDGTTDVEGRVWLNVRRGSRLGLWADVRYGVQGTTALVRRVSAADQPLAPVASKAVVNWTPGSYLRAELVPRLHLTEELALTLSLSHTQKNADEYAFTAAPPSSAPDVSVLALETEESLTQLGFGLTFSSLGSPSGRRMEVRFQVANPISGSGGRLPKGTRITMGLRLFKRFWGGEPSR
jgi:hypothetical protein